MFLIRAFHLCNVRKCKQPQKATDTLGAQCNRERTAQGGRDGEAALKNDSAQRLNDIHSFTCL